MNSHDVTARKESEARYRRVSELVSDYAFALHLDAQGTIFEDWLTDNFVEVSRVPVDQLIGTPNAIEQYIHPDDHETIRHALTALQPGERTTHDFRLVRPDGSERQMRSAVRALTKEDESVVAILGISRDIMERVQVEEALGETRRMHAMIADTVPDVIGVPGALTRE